MLKKIVPLLMLILCGQIISVTTLVRIPPARTNNTPELLTLKRPVAHDALVVHGAHIDDDLDEEDGLDDEDEIAAQTAAAIKIQAQIRRRRALNLAAQKRREHAAALRIQAQIRRRNALKRVNRIRQERALDAQKPCDEADFDEPKTDKKPEEAPVDTFDELAEEFNTMYHTPTKRPKDYRDSAKERRAKRIQELKERREKRRLENHEND